MAAYNTESDSADKANGAAEEPEPEPDDASSTATAALPPLGCRQRLVEEPRQPLRHGVVHKRLLRCLLELLLVKPRHRLCLWLRLWVRLLLRLWLLLHELGVLLLQRRGMRSGVVPELSWVDARDGRHLRWGWGASGWFALWVCSLCRSVGWSRKVPQRFREEQGSLKICLQFP